MPTGGTQRHRFELAAADEGTARDSNTVAAIAADYLRTGPRGVDLGHDDGQHLNANFRGVMEAASNMPTPTSTRSPNS